MILQDIHLAKLYENFGLDPFNAGGTLHQPQPVKLLPCGAYEMSGTMFFSGVLFSKAVQSVQDKVSYQLYGGN